MVNARVCGIQDPQLEELTDEIQAHCLGRPIVTLFISAKEVMFARSLFFVSKIVQKLLS